MQQTASDFDLSDLMRDDIPEDHADREERAVFKPTDNRIVVRLDPLDKKRRGIWLADRIAEWTAKATVIAVGPGARDEHGVRHPIAVSVGDRVCFEWRPSREALAMRKYFGPRALLLREDELDGVLEEEAGPWEVRSREDELVAVFRERIDATNHAIEMSGAGAIGVTVMPYRHRETDPVDVDPVTAREASGAQDGGGPA